QDGGRGRAPCEVHVEVLPEETTTHATRRAVPQACLMAFPAHLRAGFADEEIEIDAFVRLLHRFAVQLDPASIRMRRRRFPLCASTPELGVRHVQMQTAPC